MHTMCYSVWGLRCCSADSTISQRSRVNQQKILFGKTSNHLLNNFLSGGSNNQYIYSVPKMLHTLFHFILRSLVTGLLILVYK